MVVASLPMVMDGPKGLRALRGQIEVLLPFTVFGWVGDDRICSNP